MSQTSYPGDDPSPWSATPVDAAPSGGGLRTLLIVLSIIAGAMFVLLIAACGLAYFGLQQAIQPSVTVVLPERGEHPDEDVTPLAAALERYALPAEPPAPEHPRADELRRWFESRVALAQQGTSSPPEADLFFAAVSNSPQGKNLNLLQQFQLRASLDVAVPEPATQELYTILNIAEDSAPNTARVSVVFYAPNSLASLQTWYAIHRDGQWELYDWFEAELGRRKSDEYGHYCRHLFADHVDGFDEVEQLVYEASEASASGENHRARTLLEKAERIQMLPYDRDRGLLGIGRGYQHIDDYTRAAEVFQKAKRPATVPGILASLGVSQNSTGKPDEALELADQLRKIYPHHPAANLVSAAAYENLHQPAKTAEHYLRCLAICPDDTTVFYWMLPEAEPEHAAEIVQVLRRSEHAETYLLQLLGRGEAKPALLAAVDAAIGRVEDVPELWKTLTQAARSHAEGDIRGAVQQLNAALPAGETQDAPLDSSSGETAPELRNSMRQWLIGWSFQSGELTQLRERKDFADLMRQFAEDLYVEEDYLEPAVLEKHLAALPEEQRELPSIAAARGWAAWQEDRYAEAVTHLSAWVDAQPKPAADAAPADEENTFLLDEIPWYLNNSLGSLGRYEEALVRFADDYAFCWNTVEMLIQRRDQEAAKELRTSLADHSAPTAEMVAAALDAALATWAGDAETADHHWLACLQAFGDVDPDSLSQNSYARDAAARQRGRTAVRLGNVLPLLADATAPSWEATVDEICDRAAQRLDAQLAGLITVSLFGTQPSRDAAAEQQTLVTAVGEMNATIAARQRDWETVAEHRRTLVQATAQDDWQFTPRRRALAEALIRSGDAAAENELTPLLQTLDDDALWASYYAAQGMDTEVRDALSPLNSQARGVWYVSELNRSYVLHNQDLAQWFSQSESPLNLTPVSPSESFLLLETEPRDLNANALAEAVAAALNPEATVSQLSATSADAGAARWAIRVPEAIDVIVSVGRGRLESGTVLPHAWKELLAESQGYIAIDVLRSDRPYGQLALPLAAQLATESTHFVCEDTSGYLWKADGTPWVERLTVDESLPIDDETRFVGYVSLTPVTDAAEAQDGPRQREPELEPAAGETLAADWLQEKLAQEAAGYPVLVQISAGNAEERIPATATAIDLETWLVDLELQEDSSILPALRKGQRVRASSYNLLHP